MFCILKRYCSYNGQKLFLAWFHVFTQFDFKLSLHEGMFYWYSMYCRKPNTLFNPYIILKVYIFYAICNSNKNKRINGSKSVKLLALTVDRCVDEKSLPQIKKCIGFRDFIKSQHLNNNILF